MSRIPSNRPRWLDLSDQLMWPIVNAAIGALNNRAGPDPNITDVAYCAVIHLHHCLDTSQQANKQGKHAVAICLTRHCVESLTIIELGLGEPSYADPLISAWLEAKKTHGELRAALEKDVWPRYGSGLWDEPWSQFFGNLARAVQPYAHFSPELRGWHGAEHSGLIDDRYFIREIGVNTSDPIKASRVTLLHSLVAWTLARLLIENGRYPPDLGSEERVREFGKELALSPLLSGGKVKWSEEMWPFLFFRKIPETF